MRSSSTISKGGKGVKKTTFLKPWEHKFNKTATTSGTISRTLGLSALAKEKKRMKERVQTLLAGKSECFRS